MLIYFELSTGVVQFTLNARPRARSEEANESREQTSDVEASPNLTVSILISRCRQSDCLPSIVPGSQALDL